MAIRFGKRFGRKDVPAVILAAILTTGCILRLYHITYPPIGYHAMKEVHYLSVAKGYLDYGDFLHKRVLYSGMSEGPGYLERFPQLPLLPLVYFSLWKLFGVEVWIARLVVVAFSLGGIYLTYRVARGLGAGEELSLVAAFFMAVLPVSVFFGRNIQPDAVALFFLLLATYQYLDWIDGLRSRDLFLFSVSVFLLAAVKIPFVFALVPLLFIFPYGRLADGAARAKLLRQLVWFAPAIVMTAAWLVVTKVTSVRSEDLFPRERLFLAAAFTLGYWKPYLPLVWKYVGENFTLFCFGLFVIGLGLSALNLRTRLSRYLIGSVVSVILYFVLLSDYAVRHSYYHMPFLPVVCLGIASALHESLALAGSRGRGIVKYVLLCAVIAFAVPAVTAGINKQFDILMIGSDVAGRYIRDHGGPDDRVFLSYGSPSHGGYTALRTQFYGTLWEAGRRGAILPTRLDVLQTGEREHGVKWILLYKTEWFERDRDIRDYIRANYSIEQIGYKEDKVLYYLLHRGGTFDETGFDDVQLRLARRYRFSYGDVDLYVRER